MILTLWENYTQVLHLIDWLTAHKIKLHSKVVPYISLIQNYWTIVGVSDSNNCLVTYLCKSVHYNKKGFIALFQLEPPQLSFESLNKLKGKSWRHSWKESWPWMKQEGQKHFPLSLWFYKKPFMFQWTGKYRNTLGGYLQNVLRSFYRMSAFPWDFFNFFS